MPKVVTRAVEKQAEEFLYDSGIPTELQRSS